MESVKYEREECARCEGTRKASYGETCQVCPGSGWRGVR
jgi:DnaJ-class molecular chaperone